MAESPKFAHLEGNRGRGTRWWRQILDRNASGHNYRNSSFINCGRGYGADNRMTLNAVMAVTLHYFTALGSFGSQLRQTN